MKAPHHTCRRRGCLRPRPHHATFCTACWAAVPGWLKAALGTARRAGDAAQLTALWTKASDFARQAEQAASPMPSAKAAAA